MALFVAYEQITKTFKPEKTYQQALCGSGAAFFSSFALCPTELVKCRMQASAQTGETVQIKNLCKKIFFEKSIPGLGLFTGLTSTLLREVPGYFFFFYGKELFSEKLKKGNYPASVNAVVSGTLAGILFWSAMLPVDNIKTNMQVNDDGRGFTERFVSKFRESPRSLYSGLSAAVIRAVPANIALFYTYDKVKNKLENLNF